MLTVRVFLTFGKSLERKKGLTKAGITSKGTLGDLIKMVYINKSADVSRLAQNIVYLERNYAM